MIVRPVRRVRRVRRVEPAILLSHLLSLPIKEEIMVSPISVVPAPQQVELRDGEFILPGDAVIACRGGAAALQVGELLAEFLRPSTGFTLPVIAADQGTIVLVQTADPVADDAGFLPEAYTLDVSRSGVKIEAPSAAGLARAIQTLRQLFPAAILATTPQSATWTAPAVHINDWPRLRWRGLHLDVSRHFFTVNEVCRFIDLLALHRYNVCHLHLTDDQGWRIEIKRYPKLTEIGSKRSCTLIGNEGQRPRRYDDQSYGGFFTQDDIRQIVAFASRRHVLLVPEIDMPGHMQAAVTAYPELGNTGQNIAVRCHWGISNHILNIEDATIRFMQNVLDEVMDLFPGKFIHIGGDEAHNLEWSESHRVQQRMRELGLANEAAVQSWFIRQMDAHITAAGRRLIGWDEILEGGLADNAAVMSWRGEQGGLTAAAAGHDVVMTPSQWVYFDHYQAEPKAEEPPAIGGMTPLDRVYAYEPIPEAMPEQQHHHVLGAQAQLWTEYIATMSQLEYMTYPRASALAEVLWLEKHARSYRDFHANRLPQHRLRLQALAVNAHPRP